MFGKILIGFDDSEQARDAVAFAELVGREAGAELIVAGVLPQDPLTGGRDVFYSESDARTERAVQEAAEPVGARPVTVPSPRRRVACTGLPSSSMSICWWSAPRITAESGAPSPEQRLSVCCTVRRAPSR